MLNLRATSAERSDSIVSGCSLVLLEDVILNEERTTEQEKRAIHEGN